MQNYCLLIWDFTSSIFLRSSCTLGSLGNSETMTLYDFSKYSKALA